MGVHRFEANVRKLANEILSNEEVSSWTQSLASMVPVSLPLPITQVGVTVGRRLDRMMSSRSQKSQHTPPDDDADS